MRTVSSASLTCMASASAVECTATVAMPSSLQARRMRSAISPRLAIRILSNILSASLDDQERLAVFYRLRVLDENARDAAGARRRDRVHRLHRLHDEQRLALAHLLAFLDEGLCPRLRRDKDRADHGRLHHARMGRVILAGAGAAPLARDTRTRWSPRCTSISVSLFSSRRRVSSATSSGSTVILRLNMVRPWPCAARPPARRWRARRSAPRSRRSGPWPPGTRRNGGGTARARTDWTDAPRSPAWWWRGWRRGSRPTCGCRRRR